MAKMQDIVGQLQFIVFSQSYCGYQLIMRVVFFFISKHCHTPLNHRFQLVLWSLSLERLFRFLTLKSSVKLITTQIKDNLHNAVRRLQMLVFSQFQSTYDYIHICGSNREMVT